MSHLGERLTSLVDGQLSAVAAERAHIHLASCPDCRQAVEIERLTKQRLFALGGPEPDGELVHQLLLLAGPAGPLPPRPGHVPGSPRPRLASTGFRARPASRPAVRLSSTRPDRLRPRIGRLVGVSRSSRNRVAAAMVGAACLVGAGVVGGIAGGVASAQVVSPAAGFVVTRTNPVRLPTSDLTVDWIRRQRP